MKTLLKLAFVALLANAVWNVGGAYLTHYRFRESVREATADHRLETALLEAVLREADRYGVAQQEQDLAITLDERHTVLRGVYVKDVEILPGVERLIPFRWTVETFNAPPVGSTEP